MGHGDGVQEGYPGGEDQPRHEREADDAKKAGEQADNTLVHSEATCSGKDVAC